MSAVKSGLASLRLLFSATILASAASLISGCSSEDLAEQSDASAQADDGGLLASDATTANSSDAALGSPDATTAGGCSSQALQLIALVNEYRGENALAPIPASSSLCFVGDSHVVDLGQNSPDAPGSCNMHSWSDQGAWSPCCYTADHAQAQCMWDKPRELTVYTGNGYENAAQSGGTITPDQALNLWKGSAGHNAVILNQGIWANQDWKAMGAGLQNGYAVLWFGSSVDPAD